MSGPGCPSMADYHAHRTARRRIELMPGVELCVHLPMSPATLSALEQVARLAAQSLLSAKPAARSPLRMDSAERQARMVEGECPQGLVPLTAVDGGCRGD